MATRRQPRGGEVQTLGDMVDNKVAALIPVNRAGEPIDDSENWQMPAGPQGEEPSLEGDDAPESPSDRIMTMLSDVSDDPRAYVKISRIISAGKVGWCDDVPAGEFEQGGMKLIRDRWGPGTYQVILYGNQPGTKRFTIRTRAMIDIVAAQGGPVAVLQNPGQDMTGMMQQLLTAITAQKEAAPDPMEQMTKMLTMMKLMKDATGDGGQSKQSNLSETLALIKELKGATKLFEGGDSDDSPFGMIKDMIPGILAAVQAKQASAPVMQPLPQLPAPIQQAPAPIQQPQNAPVGVADNAGVNDMLNPFEMIKLRGNLSILVQLAAANAPIEEGAALVLDSLPDDFIDLMERDDWWSNLLMIAPPVTQFQPWFQAVRDMAISLLDDEPEESVNETATATPAIAPAASAPRKPRAAKAAGAADDPSTGSGPGD